MVAVEEEKLSEIVVDIIPNWVGKKKNRITKRSTSDDVPS